MLTKVAICTKQLEARQRFTGLRNPTVNLASTIPRSELISVIIDMVDAKETRFGFATASTCSSVNPKYLKSHFLDSILFFRVQPSEVLFAERPLPFSHVSLILILPCLAGLECLVSVLLQPSSISLPHTLLMGCSPSQILGVMLGFVFSVVFYLPFLFIKHIIYHNINNRQVNRQYV
jgi:hypothetical protein